MLDTDDFRIPAVKTYLNLGFIPVYVEEGQPKRWQGLFEKLKLPPMSAQIESVRSVLPDELWEKVSA
jgi:mycothiol synthase